MRTVRVRTVLATVLAGVMLCGLPRAEAQTAVPVRGGTLTIGVVSDPVTLDPAFGGSYFELSALYLIYEPLLAMTPDLKVGPGVASYTQPDPLTYAFQIRPGVTFQDGTPYDAAAAKFNLDRMLDPKSGSPRRADLGPMTAVTVTGPLSFTVTFSQPYAQFPLVMANRAGLFASPTAVQKLGPDFATHAVGAGPFKVTSWVKNGQLVLDRFDGYALGKPPLDRIVLRPLPDETLRMANLRSDAVQLTDNVPPQTLATLKGDAGLTVANLAGIGFNAFSLNVTRPPFDDKSVRQALMYAVDRDVVNRVAFFGTGAPAFGPIPPSVGWAFDPSFHPYHHDVAKAKQLLAASGHPNGVGFTITVVASPLQLRIAQIIQAEAQEAGFKVTVRQIDATSLLAVLQKRDFDLCYSPWSGRPDPDGNMYNWFTKGGANNFAGYSSDEVDSLLKQARGQSQQSDRAKLYRQAQQLIADDAPMLFLHFDATLQGASRKLHWTPFPDGGFHLGNAWLSP